MASPLDLLQGYASIINSFISPSFWFQALGFLLAFLSLLYISSLPLKRILSTQFDFQWPFWGLANLLFLLSLATTVYRLSHAPFSWVVATVVISYMAQWLLLSKVKITPKKSSTYSIYSPRLQFGLYLIFFCIFSARMFDSTSSTIYTPGYLVNHDSMNVVASAKMIIENLPPGNSLGKYTGQAIIDQYPLGGSMLTAMFGYLTKTDPFYLYGLLIPAGFLTILFILPQKIIKFPLIFQITLMTSLVFNYLNVNQILSAVLGSVLIIPFILASFLLLKQIITNPTQQKIFLYWLVIASGTFLYSWVIIMYQVLFFLFLFLTKSNSLKKLAGFSMIILLALAVPENLISTVTKFIQQTTSTLPEVGLASMQGNTGGFLNPIKGLSLWFSHPLFLIGGAKPWNYTLALTVIFVTLIWLVWIFNKRKINHLKIFKWPLTLFFPSILFLLTSYLITHSPYQYAKAFHHLSTLLPVSLVFFMMKFKNNEYPPIPSIHLIPLILLSVFSLSGFYALRYQSSPNLNTTQSLMTLGQKLCPTTNQILVITSNEWAKYALLNCDHSTIYYDRAINWPRMKTVLSTLTPQQLIKGCDHPAITLDPGTLPTADTLIIDSCFQLDPIPQTRYTQIVKI